jgi:DNA-binding transcriptional LysR family regulator
MNDLATGADRLDLLRTFLRIVDAGSLSAAAVQLGTTQPTVSRRLQALERQLGLRLLQRSTHGLQLTEDGLRCQRHAQRVVDEWESLQAELQGEPETLRGRLRVMVPHAFGQAQLLPTMLAFLAQHPQLSLEWILKIAARTSSPKASTARCGWARSTNRAWWHCRWPKCRASSWQRRRWCRPPRSARRNRRSHCRGSRWSPTTANACCCMTHRGARIRCRSARACSATTCSWCSRPRAGLGAAVVSAWLVAEDLAQGRLVQLLPDWQAPALPVHVVFPAARQQPPRLRAFIDAMKAALPQLHGMRPAPR